ncbi:MAG: cupin domain-containing protein [Rhodanobacteraceae bacterium]
MSAQTRTSLEVHARRNQPLGMPPARFLRDYWQKQPLLIRGAFAGFREPLRPDDLAGLACEELARARIVMHQAERDGWSLRHGPFAQEDFANLPNTDWTLLVQDVDKWDADVATLLDHFAFLPCWRIDDVMVSYAEQGGSVGAHIDQYDVFLLQGLGQRRWRVDTRRCRAARVCASEPAMKPARHCADPCEERAFTDDTELRLLRDFTPTHEWILDAGDLLYLPPDIAHHGVALGACMTYSIGMRAPARAELLLDFADAFAETMPESLRFADPDLTPTRGDGEIDDATMARVLRAMPWLRPEAICPGPVNHTEATHTHSSRLSRTTSAADTFPVAHGKEQLRAWFGRFITRYRSMQIAPRAAALSDASFARMLSRNATVQRNQWSRFAWTRGKRGATLFVAGEEYSCSSRLARMACARAQFTCAAASAPRDRDVLRALINAGHLTALRANLPRQRRRS